MDTMKKCKECKIEKSIDDFYLDRGRLRSQCKKCVRATRIMYYRAHRKKCLASVKKYDHSSRGKMMRRKWEVLAKRQKTEATKEKDRIRAQTPKGRRARCRRVNKYAKTPKGIAARRRKNAAQRAARNIENTLTAEEWNDILIRDKYACHYCQELYTKKNPATQDHVIPISKGGHHIKENIVSACRKCNTSKHNKDIKLWSRRKL